MKTKEPYIGISYRITAEELARGMKASEAVGLPNTDLARKAYLAAVECIERNNFRVILPLKFDMIDSLRSEENSVDSA